MGEVYRARDSKLDRDVAVKVLPEELARDEERLMRFQREAKVLAALNHPNVASIYGVEESDGRHFLVLELVAGETLAERIASQRFSVDDALHLARQMAEALDAAHEKNIVHRDLKPANVKLTPEGDVKVLDFGLAKAYEPESTELDLSDSPTLVKEETRDGVIMGTPAYMSPEQARGKNVDKRTDIWAFGCCVYEALSRKPAFAKETLTDTLSAVTRDEPAWDALPQSLPKSIGQLLRHCLVKDPKKRLRDIGDALAVLDGSLGVASEAVSSRKGWLVAATTAAVGALAVAAWLALTAPGTDGAPPSRWVITLPPGQQLEATTSDAVVVSPDGSRLAYAAEVDGASSLFVRELDAFEARALPGTEGAVAPFFSPDGSSLAYFIGDEIRRIDLSSDVTNVITNAPVLFVEPHGAWVAGGEIVFTVDRYAGLFRADVDTGETTLETAPDPSRGERGHRRPTPLPNGDILFTVNDDEGFGRPSCAFRRVSIVELAKLESPARTTSMSTAAISCSTAKALSWRFVSSWSPRR